MFCQSALSLLLQISLFSLAMAQPIHANHDDAWKYGTSGGIISFIILILDIIVFVEVLKSNRPVSHKLLWCLLVFLFPIVGLILYYLLSNRDAHNGSGGYEAIV